MPNKPVKMILIIITLIFISVLVIAGCTPKENSVKLYLSLDITQRLCYNTDKYEVLETK